MIEQVHLWQAVHEYTNFAVCPLALSIIIFYCFSKGIISHKTLKWSGESRFYCPEVICFQVMLTWCQWGLNQVTMLSFISFTAVSSVEGKCSALDSDSYHPFALTPPTSSLKTDHMNRGVSRWWVWGWWHELAQWLKTDQHQLRERPGPAPGVWASATGPPTQGAACRKSCRKGKNIIFNT